MSRVQGTSERRGHRPLRSPSARGPGGIDPSRTCCPRVRGKPSATSSHLSERREDLNDRRSRIVLLTDEGIDAIRSARRHIDDIERDYGRILGPDRFQTLCDLLIEIQPPPT